MAIKKDGEEQPQFGYIQNNDSEFNQTHLGKWIKAYPANQGSMCIGKLKRIIESDLLGVLNPHVGEVPDDERGRHVKALVYKDSSFELQQAIIENSTRREVESYVRNWNVRSSPLNPNNGKNPLEGEEL